MKSYKEFDEALKEYIVCLNKLKLLGIIRNQKDFTCQIGEWLVSKLYNGQISENGIEKDWDVKVGNKHFQVKSHAKGLTTKARWSRIKINKNSIVDEIIVIVFSPEYKLLEIYQISLEDALRIVKKQNNNIGVINWNDMTNFKVEIESLDKPEIISLFK